MSCIRASWLCIALLASIVGGTHLVTRPNPIPSSVLADTRGADPKKRNTEQDCEDQYTHINLIKESDCQEGDTSTPCVDCTDKSAKLKVFYTEDDDSFPGYLIQAGNQNNCGGKWVGQCSGTEGECNSSYTGNRCTGTVNWDFQPD